MITVRYYHESDSQAVGRLIANTYGEFNLSFAPPEERGPFLGPFRHARSLEKAHQDAIAEVVRAAMVYVAEEDGEVVGVLRGRKGRLASLFVRGDKHRQGIVRVASSLYAVPFYLALGYKRSTGVREGRSFEGRGLKVQPMRKVLGVASEPKLGGDPSPLSPELPLTTLRA